MPIVSTHPDITTTTSSRSYQPNDKLTGFLGILFIVISFHLSSSTMNLTSNRRSPSPSWFLTIIEASISNLGALGMFLDINYTRSYMSMFIQLLGYNAPAFIPGSDSLVQIDTYTRDGVYIGVYHVICYILKRAFLAKFTKPWQRRI